MEESSEIRRRQNRLNKQNRRKERAEKVEKERQAKEVGEDEDPSEVKEDGHEGPPLKKPRRKLRKPTAEEDVVDGFAILAFKSYDELTVRLKLTHLPSKYYQ